MKHIDEEKLETDLPYRFQYLAEFIGITEDDLNAVHAAAGAVAPLVPGLVDAVYDQLFRYDCTKRHFVPRQHGYEGEIPESIETLSLDHEMIQFRKQHLGRYLETLVTKPYDEKMMQYLDLVGKMHTPKAGSKDLNVPLVQMNALMGFVSSALVSSILGLNLDRETEVKTLAAFNKLLWLQNDLITRHYQAA
ncbi:protoglobin family protein [uncultured Gimesia sp.]|uniref:protoglobin family protein n=1 Tax=uncultured Gimesia sp. TaxID=1678688 RepID=UPI0030D7D3ED|tara:strand:+ start:135481 stop:136056 length:576 start_codon:yes stop_codon:yes gene_type:complete